jgi:sulfatase maturation enzyme AslB (radical SAM superfamily)
MQPEPSLGSEFLSCEFIEGGIMFERDRLMACCISVPNGKGRVELCEYSGGPIPSETIERRRQELREWNNHDIAKSPCEGCHKLSRQAWKNTHLISQITVSHYTICNLRCTYCYVSEYTPQQRSALSVGSYDLGPVIDDMFDRELVAPKSSACWGGGEPLMFKEFERVAARFVEHGVFMHLLTNCTIGSEAVKAGLKSGTVAVWCSVDAGTSDTYLKVKGRRRFDTVWNVLGEYSKLNPFLVIAKYIFKEDNCSTAEIDGFLAAAKKAGVSQISISQDMNEFNGPSSPSHAQLPEHLVASMAEMAFKALSSGLTVSFADSFRLSIEPEYVLDCSNYRWESGFLVFDMT